MKAFQNIIYKEGSTNKKHLLDVYAPKETNRYPVMIFVHGGSWYNGSKEWYQELGYHFASKQIVTVVINYRLGNETTYEGMAEDVAHAVKWTNEHIHLYQGDKDKIFVAGHSAGGHLAALVATNQRFLKKVGTDNLLRACLLIDAFGLNMDYIMHQNQTYYVNEMKHVFTTDTEKWKDAAPVKFVRADTLPFLILVGTQTYPHLILDNELFKMHLEAQHVPFKWQSIQGKDHMEMITDLKNPNDVIYNHIISFMHDHTALKKAS